MLYQTVILYMHQKLEKERSISGVYYILKGKQSIQTIQDAYLFELDDYYAIYKNLKKHQFIETIYELEKYTYIQKSKIENYFVLTEKGRNWLREHESLLHAYSMDGMQFKHKEPLFYARLLLLIQVWTNAQQNHFSFIPIIEDKEIADWVKYVYKKTKQNIGHYLQTLFDELITILTNISDKHEAVEIWVNQLTSHQWIGQTMYQLAQEYNVSIEDIQFMTISVNHSILRELENLPLTYPLLSSIAKSSRQSERLTASARITDKLLNQQHSLEEIAVIRKLKMNTIYDHIVEISLNDPDFPLDMYVKPSVQEEIFEAIQQVNTFKLKTIKEELKEDISYFNIRLVLSRMQQLRKKVESK